MSELVITTKDDLEKMLRSILLQIRPASVIANDKDERLNQKQAAEYLGVTEATLIRWKKQGRVPCEQLPVSSKITYFKLQLRAAMQRNPNIV
jgi:hypothetical protein